MSYNSLLDILSSSQYLLPALSKDEYSSYKLFFKSKIDAYFLDLSELKSKHYHTQTKAEFISRLDIVRNYLYSTIEEYLDGHPALAYYWFKKMIIDADLEPELVAYRTSIIDSDTKFYRTQRIYDDTIIKSKVQGFAGIASYSDLFHVPFHKRKIIGTNRFSIPGFPCLYLSDSIHTSWSEATETDFDSFHAISFSNNRQLFIVDIVPFEFSIINPTTDLSLIIPQYYPDDPNKFFLDYALLYPLIFACHSKVLYTTKDGIVKFKSEYIVPQLLMQWYRENRLLVDGIRYLSCTADSRLSSLCSKYEYYNYVIPTVDTRTPVDGFCKVLSALFSATPVYTRTKTQRRINIKRDLDKVALEIARQRYIPIPV